MKFNFYKKWYFWLIVLLRTLLDYITTYEAGIGELLGMFIAYTLIIGFYAFIINLIYNLITKKKKTPLKQND